MKIVYLALAFTLVGISAHAQNDELNAYRHSVFAYIDRLNASGRLTDQRWKALMKLADTDPDPMAIHEVVDDPLIRNDDQAMALALGYGVKDVQISAAARLQEIGKESDLPALLAAYDTLEGETLIIGGSAAFTAHDQLHIELLAALAKIMGMKPEQKIVVPKRPTDHARFAWSAEATARVISAARNKVASMSPQAL